MNVQQQNPDGSWSDAKYLGLTCEHPGCGKSAIDDFQRIPTGDEWDSEPEALCKKHCDGRVPVGQKPRIMNVQAKCSDMCFIRYPGDKEHDGYVPSNIGIGGGDYLDFEIDIDTGKIVGWNNTIRDKILSIAKPESDA